MEWVAGFAWNRWQLCRGILKRARADAHLYLERQATEVLLTAVGESKAYGDSLYLKGGTLMGIVYRSQRQTADVD
ncbi:MAG TPA: hypothetical protein VFA48_04375, partial [Gammaproteobacteria bacterium]|nr:hypothetical protein [Gammaproteobacteria bacterium]